jgi:6-phospho-3-hexuloisomerase
MTKENDFDVRTLGTRAGQDLAGVFSKFDSSQLEILSQELLAAKRIVCYGVGREGLMMAAIAMRLMHAGFKSYVVGEMVTPAVLKVAREAGGRTVIVTAQPARAAQMPVDVVIHLPAQTMVDVAAGLSILTMGTHYEAALLLLGDLLVLRLLELTNQKREDMYTRYTNMK